MNFWAGLNYRVEPFNPINPGYRYPDAVASGMAVAQAASTLAG